MAVYAYYRATPPAPGAPAEPEAPARPAAELERFAHLLGLAIDRVFHDVATARTPMARRPQGARLLRRLAPGDRLLLLDLDHLGERPGDRALAQIGLRHEGVTVLVARLGPDEGALADLAESHLHEGGAGGPAPAS